MKAKVLFIAILLSLCVGFFEAYSQNLCAPDSPANCSGWSNWYQRTWNLGEPLCEIVINCRYRVCYDAMGQSYEDLEYTIVSVTGNCTNMQSLSIYQYNLKSINELIDLLLIEDLENSGQYQNAICPNTKKAVKIYSASCGVWVKCTYDISNVNPVCEQGYDMPPPHYKSPSGTYQVDVWKYQSCGTVCCQREYTVCIEKDVTHGTNKIKIQNMSRSRYPAGAPCTQEPNGSSPKYAKPCQDGC